MFYDNYLKLCNSVNKAPSAVAIEIGLEKSSVTRWKKGTTPTDATIQKVAEYFGVEPITLKKGVVTARSGGSPSDADIKAAFWGGEKSLDTEDVDELWQDVKEYVKFKTEQKKKGYK